jgi:hypothetical protein
LYYSSDFENPVNSDWNVPTLAPASADTIRASLSIRRFDDTLEEGVGFYMTVPSGAANMGFLIKARAQAAPTQTRLVGNRISYRAVPDGVGPSTTWGSYQLVNMTMPSGITSFVYKPRQIVSLNPSQGFTPGVSPGVLYEWELSRNSPTNFTGAGATNLAGDWTLAELIIEFT